MESLAVAAAKEPREEEVAKDTFVAFARVYSGVVRRGQRVFVLGPKYDPVQGLSMVIMLTPMHARTQARRHARTHAHTHTRTHARTHARSSETLSLSLARSLALSLTVYTHTHTLSFTKH